MLSQYYKDIVASQPILTREEEIELFKQYRSGDEDILNKIILANQRFVIKSAMKYRDLVEVEDLIQEGSMGLLTAAKKFDPYRGIRFLTYAAFWVKAHIDKYLLRNTLIFRLPCGAVRRRLWLRIVSYVERIENSGYSIEDAYQLIADEYEASVNEIRILHEAKTAIKFSLDIVPDDSNESLISLLLVDHTNPEDLVLHRELLTSIRVLADSVCYKDIERLVMKNRLLADVPETLQDTASIVDYSREGIRQIELKLIDRLKRAA